MESSSTRSDSRNRLKWEAFRAWRSMELIWRRISPSTSVTRSRFCSVDSIFDSASRRRALYLLMPAASSMSVRRSSGLAETISAIRPCSTIV